MKSQKVNQNLKASLLRKRQALFQELFSIMQSELINYLEKSSPPSKTLLTHYHYHHYLKKKKNLVEEICVGEIADDFNFGDNPLEVKRCLKKAHKI